MPESHNAVPPPVIVTGMHRSGTSLTSRLLQSGGVDMGRDLLDLGSPWHSENPAFVNFHRKILVEQARSPSGYTCAPLPIPSAQWFREAKRLLHENAVPAAWGWKDPRSTLFLDLWSTVEPESFYLFVYRPPWEVIDSLYRRADFDFLWRPRLAAEVWLHYNRTILDFTRRGGDRCLVVGIHQIVQRPSDFGRAVAGKFEMPLGKLTEGLAQPAQLHSFAGGEELHALQTAFPDALEVYSQLLNCDALAPAEAPELSIGRGCQDPDAVFEAWMESRRRRDSLRRPERDIA